MFIFSLFCHFFDSERGNEEKKGKCYQEMQKGASQIQTPITHISTTVECGAHTLTARPSSSTLPYLFCLYVCITVITRNIVLFLYSLFLIHFILKQTFKVHVVTVYKKITKLLNL